MCLVPTVGKLPECIQVINIMIENILLTGSSGFIGSKVKAALEKDFGIRLTAPTLRLTEADPVFRVDKKNHCFGDEWGNALLGQQVVIHTAAKTPATVGLDRVRSVDYRRVNVNGTLNLAMQAAQVGVKRFIFISSIKVNGESTKNSVPFKADDIPAPTDIYSVSKLEAEEGLLGIASATGLEVVIIRAPMVYGPGAVGNFNWLKMIVKTGVPLPFASIQNYRSMVAFENLVDLIITCIVHPKASNEVFLISDGEDLSTPDIVRGLSDAIGQTCRLFSFPPTLLNSFAKCVGKGRQADKLLGSLQVDIQKTKRMLGWSPPFSVRDQFKKCFQG